MIFNMSKSDMRTSKGFFTVALLLADIKGFAALSDDKHLTCFFDKFLPNLINTIEKFTPQSADSLGNSLFCTFNEPVAAADCALELRDFFHNFGWNSIQLPRLAIRISLHTARAYGSPGRENHNNGLGIQMNLAKRIEPIVRPGEVWTSDSFVKILRESDCAHIATDNFGAKPLAQKWGGQEIHRIRRITDPPLEDYNIYEMTDTARVDPVAILLSLYDRGDEEQQVNSVRMLGKKGDPRAVEKLCSIALDGNLPLRLRLNAVKSLGEQKNSNAVPTLTTILAPEKNEDPRLQIACINAIMAIGNSHGGKIILNILENVNAYQEAVTRKAVESLVFVKYQPAVDSINDDIMQGLLPVSLLKTALQVLSVNNDHKAAHAVMKLIGKDNPQEIRNAALMYLIHGNPHVITAELQGIAGDPRETMDIRVIALNGLTKIDTNETRTTLAEIAEAAEALSSYAAQFLIEGKDLVEKLEREFIEDFKESLKSTAIG